MQRALAAKSVAHAQTGLMVGGLIKYFMAVIIVVPGIALYGLLGDGLAEPDLAFPYLVKTYLPVGIKGIILCGLFASLMSTVDSTFNSLATLWSTDIYAVYIRPEANDKEKIQAGRSAILVSLGTALVMGMVLLYVKFDRPEAAFTHTLNNLRYFINCGIVVLICSAVLMLRPNKMLIFIGLFNYPPAQSWAPIFLPEMNYFVRAFWVIALGLSIVILGNHKQLIPPVSLFQPANRRTSISAWVLVASLLLLHLVFH